MGRIHPRAKASWLSPTNCKKPIFITLMILWVVKSFGNIDQFLMTVEKYHKEHDFKLEDISIYFRMIKNVKDKWCEK